MDVDEIRKHGEEEYIIMNLDSRQMDHDGDAWNVTNTKGQPGLDEPIPYVTSIELVDSYIPNTFYNIEEYNNVIVFGTELEHYVLNNERFTGYTGSVYSVDGNGFKEIPGVSESGNVENAPPRQYIKFCKVGSEFEKGSFFVKQSKIDKIEHTYAGLTATIGYKITLSRNDENAGLRNVENVHDTFPMYVVLSSADGTIIKQGDIDGFEITILNSTSAHTAFKDKTTYDVGNMREWFNDENDPSSPRIVGDLFEDPLTSTDDIPENTSLRVFTKKTIFLPIQNYTVDVLTALVNGHITEHMKEIYKNYEDTINKAIQYNIFLNLHLQIEYDSSSRKFSFVSKHGHGFMLDFTHTNSAHTEFGFSKKLYISSEFEYVHRQNISIGEDKTSLNFSEIKVISDSGSGGTSDEIYVSQVYNTNFYETPVTKDDIHIFGTSVETTDGGSPELTVSKKILEDVSFAYVNDYPYTKKGSGVISDTLLSYVSVEIVQNKDPIILFKKSNYNIFANNLNQIPSISWYIQSDKYAPSFLDKTYVEHVDYRVKSQRIRSDNIINLSGERYVDLVCPEIQKELKRYNAGYNKLNRYYFDDISDLYVTSSKGNIAELVMKNPREFGPISKLSRLSFKFLRSDGFLYDFKNIPFFMTVSIKYLKPVLRT